MTTLPPAPAALPEPIALEVFGFLKTDRKFAIDEVIVASGATVPEITAGALDIALSNRWHGRLEVGTRDRIVLAWRRHNAPSEPEPRSPIAESAVRRYRAFDSWSRESAIHEPEHVAIIGEPVENNIAEDGTGTFRIGGAR